MLISEFSGANKAFSGFLDFNPFNVKKIVLTLYRFMNFSLS